MSGRFNLPWIVLSCILLVIYWHSFISVCSAAKPSANGLERSFGGLDGDLLPGQGSFS